MQRFLNLFLFATTFAFFCVSNTVHADGLKGGLTEVAGRAVGFKALEDLGKNADAENKKFKDKSQFYKLLDEAGATIAQAPFSLACTSTFESVIGVVRSLCSGANSQPDPELINKAKQQLIEAGLLKAADFSGVSISWCAGGFTGSGITPNHDEIMLNSDLKADPFKTSTTLAHEMQHVLQYRRMGSGPYKCEYARYYSRCGGCQDGNHPLEKEAYQFEDHADNVLNGTFISSDSSYALSSAVISGNSLPVLPSSVPGDLERMDCKDCFTYLRSPGNSHSKSGKKFFDSRRNIRLSLNAERKAKTTCGFNSKPLERAIESCIDDMTVIYTEILEKVVGDYAVGRRKAVNDYWRASKQDMVDACSILRATSNNVEIGKRKLEGCTLRTNSAVREMVSYAKQKYPK